MWFKSKEKEDESGLFTQKWMDEWIESINKSKEFKQKGKNWSAPLIIKFEPLPQLLKEKNTTGIYLDLKYGECKELRYSTKSDEDICDVILSADEKTWIQLMEKGADPASMILNNRLSLEKGSLILLSTQSKAAKALLKTAPTSNIGINRSKEIIKPKNRTHFTTTRKGVDLDSLPMQLFRESKLNKLLKPSTVEYSKEREGLKTLGVNEKKIIAHFLSLILACKEASIIDQTPLMQIIADEERVEEQMYMNSMLNDESNNLEFLTLYVKEVIGNQKLDQFHGPHFKSLLYHKLPQTTNLLKSDPSPLAQIKACLILNIIVKRIIAKTCYLTFYESLSVKNILPDLQKGILDLVENEKRHETFASYFINRVLDGDKNLREPFEKEMQDLFYDGTNIIQEIFTFYDDEDSIEIKKERMLNKAIAEYQNALSGLD